MSEELAQTQRAIAQATNFQKFIIENDIDISWSNNCNYKKEVDKCIVVSRNNTKRIWTSSNGEGVISVK